MKTHLIPNWKQITDSDYTILRKVFNYCTYPTLSLPHSTWVDPSSAQIPVPMCESLVSNCLAAALTG